MSKGNGMNAKTPKRQEQKEERREVIPFFLFFAFELGVLASWRSSTGIW
jgi:hypothetical protein